MNEREDPPIVPDAAEDAREKGAGRDIRDSPVMRRNMRIVSDMEKRALAARTLGERIGDAVARAVGSMWMVAFHLVWFGGWILLNVGIVPGVKPFDPFPFGFLTLVVSLEAIFLSLFLLISQNRLTREADKRARLDLQINLLAEQETTKILEMLARIAEHLNIETTSSDEELAELESKTDIEAIAAEVDRNFPEA